MKNILIIEDDQEIVELVEIHIADINGKLAKAYDGDTGLELALSSNYDLIILDLMLPGKNGLDICKALRESSNTTPILMLTAKSEEIDKVLGLEMGADDYLTKPFGIRELLARIKAIMRRTVDAPVHLKEHILHRGDLDIDLDKKKVSLAGARLDLSRKEFEILALLASNPGKSYSRTNLLQTIWGYEFDGYEHTVNSHINRLRAKIEPDPSQPKYVLTSWGIGYRFNEEV